MKATCLACGYPALREPPRSRSGGGSFEICPSCGFQFGVTDDDRGISPLQWREQWRSSGMKWSSVQPPPKNWDATRQLKGFLKVKNI